MIPRRPASLPLTLVTLAVVVLLGGCSSIQSITVTPASGMVVLTSIGQTAQYSAQGTSTMGNAEPTTSDITTSVTWSVSQPSVATINASGLATATGYGHTEIVAQSNGRAATSDLTVEPPAGGGSTTPAINVIPGAQTVASPGNTAQFIAIGTAPSGTTTNLTSQVAWSSSSLPIATVGPTTGMVTAISQGTATITALYTNPTTGGVVTGTATFTVNGGTAEQFTAVTILPGSQALSASGQTGQFVALATSGVTGLQADVTKSVQIKWSSSSPTVATVSPTGLATGASAGTTTVTAELTNPDGSVVSNTATIVVSLSTAPEPLLSLTIIPSSVTVLNLLGTGQFLAIGTYSTPPYVRDLTNSPNLTWVSSAPSVFTVDTNTGGNPGTTAGLVTAYGSGNATIIAEATNPLDGTIQTATATFNCPLALPNPGGNPPTPGTCVPGTQAPALLSTLTLYNEGANTTNWEVTAPSATGTPNVLHCGPGWTLNGGTGGSVCTATYPVGTSVTLTAPNTGAAFGGWSFNCLQQGIVSAAGPNTCTVVLTQDDTVGAIFN